MDIRQNDILSIRPVAYFRSPLKTKFGIPKQSGLAGSLKGRIVFVDEWRSDDAIRGLDGFDFIWLVWGFSANKHGLHGTTVRPPVLGGNQRVGIWATRSPFRPNGLGLSSVKVESIEHTRQYGPVINVNGADLMDMTPIYDIKPYVAYADSHPSARSGFTGADKLTRLNVVIPPALVCPLDDDDMEALREVLALDPRPSYHNDRERIYGLDYLDYDIRFKVNGNTVTVVSVDHK